YSVFMFFLLMICRPLLSTLFPYTTLFRSNYFPDVSVLLVQWVNVGLTFVVITALFAFIFRFLPDARMRFRDVVGGALFTAALFMLGRYLIALYMQFSAPASAYGAAGAIIVLLLWVYYSAAILYFGAEFTTVYALKYGGGVWPSSYAVKVILTEEEVDDEPIRMADHQNNDS